MRDRQSLSISSLLFHNLKIACAKVPSITLAIKYKVIKQPSNSKGILHHAPDR